MYVVLGDGECDEGQVWEAAMAAAKSRLGNLIAFIDFNDLQLDGRCRDVMPLEPLADKWRAFNWRVLEIDGNDMAQVFDAVAGARGDAGGGPGPSWHAQSRAGACPSWRTGASGTGGLRTGTSTGARCGSWAGTRGAPRFAVSELVLGRRQSGERLLFGGAKEIPTRDAYGEALVELDGSGPTSWYWKGTFRNPRAPRSSPGGFPPALPVRRGGGRHGRHRRGTRHDGAHPLREHVFRLRQHAGLRADPHFRGVPAGPAP